MRLISDLKLLSFAAVLSVGSLLVSSYVRAADTGEAPGLATEQGGPAILKADVFSRDGKTLLFNFTRVVQVEGSKVNVTREFAYPGGKLAVREHVTYEMKQLVSFDLQELQIGATGCVRVVRDLQIPGRPAGLEICYAREPGSRPKVRNEPLRDNTLIADMVGDFLAKHWDELVKGVKVRCRLVAMHRTETIGFTFVRAQESEIGSQKVLMVKMEPTSSIVAALIDPLTFAVEFAPSHRVLQYQGRTSPKMQAGSKWKDLDALTVFYWNSTNQISHAR